MACAAKSGLRGYGRADEKIIPIVFAAVVQLAIADELHQPVEMAGAGMRP